MSEIANKEVICNTLIKRGRVDRRIVALASDSRGSASMKKFAEELPEQFVEVGIAEQNIVGIAAGLSTTGKIPFITSYAAFLTMRSIEQIKLDIAYSNNNVKVIGISGGLSYGPLGMSHHSLQDIAVMMAIPNMKVFLPADRYETGKLINLLIEEKGPVYVRVGRNPEPAVHSSSDFDFQLGKAITVREGEDITLIGTGRTVDIALRGSRLLKKDGIKARVLSMHTLKPLDKKAILGAAEDTGKIITIEEHSIYGGLGAAVSQILSQYNPVPMKIIAIPDEPAIAGKPKEVFGHYGLTADNIRLEAIKLLS